MSDGSTGSPSSRGSSSEPSEGPSEGPSDTSTRLPDGRPFPDDLIFHQAMSRTHMAVCLTDPLEDDHPIVFVNEAFESLTGYAAEEVLGKNCRFLQGADTDPDQVRALREAIADEDVAVLELNNYRKSGERFVNALHLGPVYDDDGALVYYFGSMWDVSELRELRDGHQRERARAEEISRRVRNLFAVVNAVIGLSCGDANGKLGRNIVRRILALSRAYETTFEADAHGGVDLELVLRTLLGPYMPAAEERLSITGRDLRIGQNIIALLSLAFHELATAATRHGALGGDGGVVDVSWRTVRPSGAQQVEILWTEETVEGGEARVVSDDEKLAHELVDELVETIGGDFEVTLSERMLEARLLLPLAHEQFP